MSIIGALRVDLGLNSASFDKGLSNAKSSLQSFGMGMAKTGGVMTAGITAPLVTFGLKSVEAFRESEVAGAKLENVIKTMGGASGKTADELKKSATALETLTAVDGDQILGDVTSTLLTFGNIAGEQFDQAQVAVLDMSRAMKTDLQSASVMLGKALNDPAKGLSALSKNGVSFTDSQKDAVEAMVAMGDTAGAQKIILAELGREFAGQAQAFAETDEGKAQADMIAMGNAMEKVGAVISPILADLSLKIKSVAEAFGSLSPDTQKLIVYGAGLLAIAGPAAIAMGAIIALGGTMIGFAGTALASLLPAEVGVAAAFSTMATSAWAFTTALLANPITWVVVAIAGLVTAGVLLYQNWDLVKAKAQELWATVSNAFGSLKSAAIAKIQELVAGVGERFASIKAIIYEKLSGAVTTITTTISGWYNSFSGGVQKIISGVGQWFGQIPTKIASALMNAVGMISNITGMWWTSFKNGIQRIIDGVKGMAGNIVAGLVNGIKAKIGEVTNAIANLANSAIEKARSIFAIFSPSRVFKAIGAHVGDGLAIGIDGKQKLVGQAGADLAQEAVTGADNVVAGIMDKFIETLSTGDVFGAFKGVFENIKAEGIKQFSEMFKKAFASDGSGKGFSGLFSGLSQSFGAVKTGFSALTGGLSGILSGATGALSGALGGLSGMIGGAIPMIGAGMALFSAVKSLASSFSSKKVTGTGMSLGIGADGVMGGTSVQTESSSWWGLKKKTRNKTTGFENDTMEAFNAQISGIKNSAKDVYGALGLAVSDSLLNSVTVATQQIDTTGLSESQIQAKISEIFAKYEDALSKGIGGITFNQASILAGVNETLAPIGKGFAVSIEGWFSSLSGATSAGVAHLQRVAKDAEDLSAKFGGLQALSTATKSFYDGFYTDAEKLADLNSKVSNTFASMGSTIPSSLADFKALVLAQDLSTENGRAGFKKLMDISSSFKTATEQNGKIVSDAVKASQDAMEAIIQAEKDKNAKELELKLANAKAMADSTNEWHAKLTKGFSSLDAKQYATSFEAKNAQSISEMQMQKSLTQEELLLETRAMRLALDRIAEDTRDQMRGK